MRDDSAEIPIQSFMWQFRDKQGLVLKYMWTRACLVSGTERPVFESVDIENHLGERPTLFLQFTSAQFLCQLAVRGNSKDDLRTSFLFLFFLFFFWKPFPSYFHGNEPMTKDQCFFRTTSSELFRSNVLVNELWTRDHLPCGHSICLIFTILAEL